MSTEAITRLRELFEAELTKNPSLYHEIDVQRVRTEDWQVKRYLLEFEHDEAKAFEALLKTLKWKCSFGLHTRVDTDFPLEYWQMYVAEDVGTDRKGRLIHWEAAKRVRNFPESDTLTRQFLAHLMERIDRAAGEQGACIVADTNGASLFNIDQGIEQFKIDCLAHYPQLMHAFYIVDQPWLLAAIIRLIMSWMDPKLRALVQFVSAKQLPEYIDEKWIPASMKGGQREKTMIPEGLLPLDQMAVKLGLSEKFVDNFYKTCKFSRSNNNK